MAEYVNWDEINLKKQIDISIGQACNQAQRCIAEGIMSKEQEYTELVKWFYYTNKKIREEILDEENKAFDKELTEYMESNDNDIDDSLYNDLD